MRFLPLANIAALTALVATGACTSDSDGIRPDPSSAAGMAGGGVGGTQAAGGGVGGTQAAGGGVGGAQAAGGSAGEGGTSAAGSAGLGNSGTGGTGSVKHTCDAPRFGSPMIELPSPSGVSYCMDSRPPSQKEYKAFLDSKKGDVSGQAPRCSDNTSYEIKEQTGSDSEPNACPMGTFTPEATPDKPVHCVDFCDGAAYCAWAGKRLCGKIGGGDYPLDQGWKGVDGEWTNACSQGGKYEYPTGTGTDPMPCKNGFQNGIQECKVQTVPPFDGLLAMGVLFREWIDSCGTKTAGGSDYTACAVTGVNLNTNPPVGTPCNLMSDPPLSGIAPGLSFRCCAE